MRAPVQVRRDVIQPGRLPYLAASDRTGGLLLLEYTPPDTGPHRTLANELYVGQVALRHSGSRLALYDRATISLDLLADYRSRITLIADLSTLQLLHLPAGAYGVGLAAPMRFLDRTFIFEPYLLHSGLTYETRELARDLVGYRFGNYSVGRQFGLLGGGIRSNTSGTTARVLNAEARLHFLQATDIPVLNGISVAAFADGGVFWGAPGRTGPSGDVTIGGALGIDWLSISLSVEAGYNHADAGFVWGVEFRSF